MEEMKVQPEEQEIDLLEVICVLWHRARLLLLSLVIGAALAGAVTLLAGAVTAPSDTPETPVYRATSTICGFSVNSDAETYLMELELFGALAKDLRVMATTREVVEPALDACGLERSYEDIVDFITVVNPADTHMLQIHVNDKDPQLAAQLSDAVADQLRLKVAEVIGIDVPAIAERAAVPTQPINSADPGSPIPANLKRNCILGGILFFVLAAGAVLMVHFFRDSFKEKMAVIRRSGTVK